MEVGQEVLPASHQVLRGQEKETVSLSLIHRSKNISCSYSSVAIADLESACLGLNPSPAIQSFFRFVKTLKETTEPSSLHP